jgi:tetratricopeptide (TPR) repeat protein
LNIDREQRCLEGALADLKAHQVVELAWLINPTWRAVQQEIRRNDWHIFHFIGHGGFDREANTGFVAFADDTGSADNLSATQLGRLLGDHEPLRLALLNACEGAQGSMEDIFAGTAANLVRRGTPAVLAMQYPISDKAAIEFARTFYEALADAWPVDAAVAEARKAITFAASSTVEWGIPVLFMRASDGMVFDIPKQTATDKLSDQIAEGAQPAPSEDARPKESADPQPDQQLDALFAQLSQAQAKRAWDTVIELGTQILELARTQQPIRSKVAEAYIACGHSNYQSTNFDQAIVYFDLAIAIEPERAVWYYWRGISYEQKGRHEEAATDIHRALGGLDHLIQQTPDNAEYVATRGRSYAWKGDFDLAIADLSRAIDLAPNTADYYYVRGSSYSELADFSHAIADFSRAVNLVPTNPDYHYARASAYYGAGHYERAIADLNQAIDANPNNPRYYQMRGSSFYQAVFYGYPANGYDRAIDDFRRAIELDPGNPDHYYARGNSYYQQAVHRSSTDIDNAIADFVHAIDLAPNTADYYYARGMCYKLQRNRQAAQQDFKRAVQLGHPQAKSELDLWERLFS